MFSVRKRSLLSVLACLVLVVAVVPVVACPFCNSQGQTLTGDLNQATMVVYGKMKNGTDKQGEATSILEIESVIKEHEFCKDKKEIDLGRNFDPNPNDTYRYVVFCDVFRGKLDPFRGFAVKVDKAGKSDVAAYLKGALKVKDSKPGECLRFFFDYLDNADSEVSMDALKEFGNADYKDYQDMAKKLPPDKIAAWLKDPNTPSYRLGLYASLLGHCGKAEHADILRDMLMEKGEKPATAGLDGIIAAYTMLRPKDGYAYMQTVAKDPQKDFMYRYAVLRALRFTWQYRTDLVSQKEIAECAAVMIDQKDIADLAIEDLRKWGRWECADRILALQKTDAYQKTPIIRRAVLRYALRCKGCAAIDTFVADQRKKDPEGVKNAEELLELTEPVVAPPVVEPPASKKPQK